MVSRAPGAPQTPKIGNFRPAQKSCIKNTSVIQCPDWAQPLPAEDLASYLERCTPALRIRLMRTTGFWVEFEIKSLTESEIKTVPPDGKAEGANRTPPGPDARLP